MPFARGSRLYVAGGSNGSSATNLFHYYDTTTGTWTSPIHAPTAIQRGILVQSGGKLYSMGGLKGSNNVSGQAFVYDPSTANWDFIASPPFARWAQGAAAVNGEIYLFGGPRRTSLRRPEIFYAVRIHARFDATVYDAGIGEGYRTLQ